MNKRTGWKCLASWSHEPSMVNALWCTMLQPGPKLLSKNDTMGIVSSRVLEAPVVLGHKNLG